MTSEKHIDQPNGRLQCGLCGGAWTRGGTFVSREYIRVVNPLPLLRYDTGDTFPCLTGVRGQSITAPGPATGGAPAATVPLPHREHGHLKGIGPVSKDKRSA